ncbi:hypothetical protein EV360DRAFT_68955 [Lentinula raphanica]|nr:hypothetical protein EV360DRAFT_68955 [Lentinula raphanica]
MVRSRFVLIFVALGATSIAAAAPLRLASIVAEPASQEAASCALFGQDPPESGDPQDCGKSGLNVSPGEHNNVLDMNSFPSTSHDSSGIVPLSPFLSPSSQERVDDDTANVPGSIESLATHPSGPFDFPLIQEGVDADDTASVPSIESLATHPSGPFDFPLIQKGVNADDTASVPSIEPLATHPSGPFDFPLIQEDVDSIESRAPYQASTPFDFPSIKERTDADDTDSAPSIESHALHPSGPFELVRRSIGVLSPGTPHAPNAHSLLRKRTDTEIASAHDPDSPIAFRSSVPRQPTSAFSTSSLSIDAASLDQREDAREEEDTVSTAHSIASVVRISSASISHPSPASVEYPLLRKRTDTGEPSGPLVVSTEMMHPYDDCIARLPAPDAAAVIRKNIKNDDRTMYEKNTEDSRNWDEFVRTNSGKLWLEIDRFLSQSHPTFDRILVKNMIAADIILAHLKNAPAVYARDVYNELKASDSDRYKQDIKAYTDFVQFLSFTETGRLCSRVTSRIIYQHRKNVNRQRWRTFHREDLRRMISTDIRFTV